MDKVLSALNKLKIYMRTLGCSASDIAIIEEAIQEHKDTLESLKWHEEVADGAVRNQDKPEALLAIIAELQCNAQKRAKKRVNDNQTDSPR